MRFDLVDLQLFIAVAETRSITGGANRVHLALASASARIKGLEAALGVSLLKRGRRGVELTAAGESLLDHARIVMHNVEAMRGDLAAFSPAASRPPSACSPTPPACRNICRRRWPPSSASIPTSPSTSRSAKAATSRTPSPPVPPISASPPNMRCPKASSGYRSARTAWCWWRRAQGRAGEPAAGRFPRGGGPRFRRPDHLERAACPCHRPRGAARRAPALSRADEQFRCDRPDGGGRHRRRRDAGSRGQTLRALDEDRVVRIRDPWANRRLAICARSFKALPRPAQQLVEHLRKMAPR